MTAGGYWQVPELWPGSTIVLLGGGPSLTPAQVDYCRGRARVIAINNAYRLAPWADVLYFCEEKFWHWNRGRAEFRDFAGIKVALETAAGGADDGDGYRAPDVPGQVFACVPGLHRLKNYKDRPGLELDERGALVRDGLRHAWSSGGACLNLAPLFGGRRVVLLGFDMKAAANGDTHWHKDYPLDDGPDVYAEKMLGYFPPLVEPLRRLGVDVVNATPGSAIDCFPRLNLEAAIP